MSMMDVMNTPPQGEQQGQPAAAPGQPPQQPAGGQPAMEMGDSPEKMQSLFNSVMGLVSQEIWQNDGADRVADRLNQEDSQPAEVIGTFTGFYLMMATSAARSKGGMLPPIVVVGAAGQIAAQLTDIALMMKLISPGEADDTADAGALIGIEVLLKNNGQQMAPDEANQYNAIADALIKASPQAEKMAAAGTEEAIEEVQELHEEPDGDEGPNPTAPSDNDGDEGMHQMPDGSTMANAMMPGGR